MPRDPTGATYRSKFGGLWPDLSNALHLIEEKESRRSMSAAEADLFREWITRGFVILPGAVSHELIDRLDAEVEDVWSGRSPFRYFVEVWENDVPTIQRASLRFKESRLKLLDLHAHSEIARQIVFSPPITRFLTLLFEQPAVAFQSLYFRWGTGQDVHQDAAFVKVSSPMKLAASWIALEDVKPDSGELEYYVGSHQIEDYLFEGRHKWMPVRSPEYAAFVESLHQRSQARGLPRQQFRPKKGDALIWSADLVHGGSKRGTEGVTRKSLVTHFCPQDCNPVYPGVWMPHRRHTFSDSAHYIAPPEWIRHLAALRAALRRRLFAARGRLRQM
jgi:phytanoyl-CoA hydroxylase